MKEVYVIVYHHINGTQYVQINATQEGQERFFESLNKDLFEVESFGLIPVDD